MTKRRRGKRFCSQCDRIVKRGIKKINPYFSDQYIYYCSFFCEELGLSEEKEKKLQTQLKNRNEKILKRESLVKYRELGKDFLKSKEWKKLRYEALRIHGASCFCCGRNYRNHGVVIHVDHIKPRSRYPSLAMDINNLQILCEECNLGKGYEFQDDWRPQTLNG